MLRIFIAVCIFSFALTFDSHAQGEEVFVTVKGKALDKNDSTALQGVTVFYEKLPYYDDMGMSKTSTEGEFSFNLAKNTTYSFRIEGVPGYQEYVEEVIIEDEDGNQQSTISLFIAPEEKEELITLDNLNFGRGSATIQNSSYQSLNDFIEYINQRKDVLIQLEGHTDFAGNAEANMRLSQARVDAVAEYLSKNGVKKSRITTKAFGGSRPLTQDRTDEAKKRNRRVEVRLIRQ
jgi:OOP family OmpA-OmpF porin